MSVLNDTILATLEPSTESISTLSYRATFFKEKVKPCSFKSLVNYGFLSVCNDYGAWFIDPAQFQCVTGNSVVNPFVPIFTSEQILSFTCQCSLADGGTEFSFTPKQVINGVIDNSLFGCFLQFFDTTTNTWQFVLDSSTGFPYSMSSGVNTFEPVIQFLFAPTKFRLININNNTVSPSVIVDVLQCNNSGFILTEDSSFVLQEDSSFIKTE